MLRVASILTICAHKIFLYSPSGCAHIVGEKQSTVMPDNVIQTEPRRRLRKPTNVSLPPALVAEAAALKINLSRACEAGLAEAVAEARRNQWLEANREALDFWNDEIDRKGLPLDAFRQF
jgi:antitoxin CcdA